MQPRVPRSNAGRPGASSHPPVPLGRALRQRPDRARPEDPGDSSPGEAGSGPGAPGPASLEALRRKVAQLEGRVAPGERLGAAADGTGGRAGKAAADGRLRLGVHGFDGLFRDGLPLAAVTEVRAAETRLCGALTGFAAALLVRVGLVRCGPVLWVRERQVRHETGVAAGLGLLHLGLDPARLIVVSARDAAEVLWAMEEGLGCPGLAGVVGEVHGLPRPLDLTASRRLALRAREGGVPGLLLGHALPPAASAAAVRLAVSPRLSHPAGGFPGGPGFPAWTVVVEKNRDGRTGRADLQWNSDDRCFSALAPLPVDMAADAADGPPRPPALGQVLAHPATVRRAS
jgi:protein ImuA